MLGSFRRAEERWRQVRGFVPVLGAAHGPWQQRDDTLIRVLLGAGANPDAVAEYTGDDRATVDEPFNEEEKICDFWFHRGRAHGMNCLQVARRTAEVTAGEEEAFQESKDEFVNDIVERVRKAFLDKCGRVPGEEAPSA